MTRGGRIQGFALTAVLLAFVLVRPASGQAPIYPGKTWTPASPAEQLGWSADKLKEARTYAATLNTAAVMIVAGGGVLDEWGETATRFNVHSIRKSYLSALYGIHVREGRIQLSRTLADLSIDDHSASSRRRDSAATTSSSCPTSTSWWSIA